MVKLKIVVGVSWYNFKDNNDDDADQKEGLLSIRILWLLLLHGSPFSVVSLVGGLMQINCPFFSRYTLSCRGRARGHLCLPNIGYYE